MRRLRILLVEDDCNISALIVELLADMGHDVCSIGTTEREAVVAAERLSPDLMIVDVVLRVGGGVSAMATILRRTAMPHIFMTGGSRRGIPDNAEVLQKPFGTLGLTAALDSIASQIAAAT
jgi:DNA-binding response OmpR family regulator